MSPSEDSSRSWEAPTRKVRCGGQRRISTLRSHTFLPARINSTPQWLSGTAPPKSQHTNSEPSCLSSSLPTMLCSPGSQHPRCFRNQPDTRFVMRKHLKYAASLAALAVGWPAQSLAPPVAVPDRFASTTFRLSRFPTMPA